MRSASLATAPWSMASSSSKSSIEAPANAPGGFRHFTSLLLQVWALHNIGQVPRLPLYPGPSCVGAEVRSGVRCSPRHTEDIPPTLIRKPALVSWRTVPGWALPTQN